MENFQATIDLALAEYEAGNFQKALDTANEAVKADDQNYQIYAIRCKIYTAMSQWEKAISDAEKCIQIQPQKPDGYLGKAQAEYNWGGKVEAIETCKEGLKSIQNCPEITKILDSYTKLRENDCSKIAKILSVSLNESSCTEFMSIVETILKNPSNQVSQPSNGEIRQALITLALQTNDKHFINYLSSSQDPENAAEYWKKFGNEYYKKKQFTEALAAYKAAKRLNPKNVTYPTNEAAVYLEMQDYSRCLDTCQKIIDERYQLKPDYEKVAKVYARMAAAYTRMESYENAIHMYEKALTECNTRQYRALLNDVKNLKEKQDRQKYINPELAEQHRLAGNGYFQKCLYPEAKKEYDEAIKRNPNDAKLFANRSAALLKLGELPMALEDATASLELDPKVAKIWARKGKILMMMKAYNKALKAYEKGLEVEPDHYDCRVGLSEVVGKVQQSVSSQEVDQDQLKHAMADPEIQAIMNDPQTVINIKKLVEDPSKTDELFKDPKLAESIRKLMAAGILKVAE